MLVKYANSIYSFLCVFNIYWAFFRPKAPIGRGKAALSLSIFDTSSYNDVKRCAILGVVMAAAKKERCE